MKFCTNCGNAMKEGAKFCNKCGTAADVNGQTPISLERPEEGGKKKAIGRKTVAITIAILLLLVAGISAYGYFNGFDKLPLVGAYFANDGEEVDMAVISEDEQASPASSPEPTPEATPTSEPLPDVGDIIEFGGYDWRVLEVKDGKALVISEYVLYERQYHNDHEYPTWAESEIRQYLNGQFLESFTAAERNIIAETRNANADNPWFGTPGGSDTTDYIFLLSLDEVVRYFGDSGQLENRPEDAYTIDDQFNDARRATRDNGEASWWWLRSPSDNSLNAAFVRNVGTLNLVGASVRSPDGGVRPALWLNLDPESDVGDGTVSSTPSTTDGQPGGTNTDPIDARIWGPLYIDAINGIEDGAEEWGSPVITYALAYIDGDDIPELLVYYHVPAGGYRQMFTVSAGALQAINLDDMLGDITYYLVKENRFLLQGGRMDNYFDTVCSIQDGEVSIIHSGKWGAEDNTSVIDYVYTWDGQAVYETEYQDRLAAAFDWSRALYLYDALYSYNACRADDMIATITYMY